MSCILMLHRGWSKCTYHTNVNKIWLKRTTVDICVLLLTSSPVKPYCCSTCGKSYRQISLLNLHRKRHTGEARYSCDECGKLFTTSGNLKRHQLVHSGKKPYHCEYCERTFSDPTAKMRHLEIHDTDKGHKCPQCDKKFNQVRERERGCENKIKGFYETQWWLFNKILFS